MNHPDTISCYIVKQWFDMLVNLGIDISELERRSTISMKNLHDIDGRIPLERHFKLMQAGVELTGNSTLALDVGKAAKPENMGALGRVLLNCSTLREAGIQSTRYSKLVSESCYIELKESKKEVALIHRKQIPKYNTIPATEEMLAAFVSTIRYLSPVDIQFREIHFQQSSPSYIHKYEEFFNCPIKFNQPLDQLFMDIEILNIHRENHDPYLLNLLTNKADVILNNISEKYTVRKQVSEKILKYLPTGELDIEKIASSLKVSRWTLNRKLKREDSSFKNLLQEIRYDMAKNYLRMSIPIYEITFLLGYSEPSAFNHAFKIWSGKSPGDFRKELISTDL